MPLICVKDSHNLGKNKGFLWNSNTAEGFLTYYFLLCVILRGLDHIKGGEFLMYLKLSVHYGARCGQGTGGTDLSSNEVKF